MPDSKITALASTGTGTDPANDPLVIVDVSDTSMAASGTTKKVTLNNLLACSPTATLASATITGALTIGGATSFPASVINTSGGNPVFTPTAATLFLYSGSSFLSIRNQANTQEIFNLTPAGVYTFGDGSGGTRMTLNSTGLGVGGSPDTGLFTVGATTVTSATTPAVRINSNKAVFVITSDGATNAAGTTINYSWANGGQGPLIFRNAAIANVMTLDSTGNVGISVTPSAWNAGYKAIELGSNVGSFSATTGIFDSALNAYFNTSSQWIYKTTAAATLYRQQAGQHQWFNAASGTAGNAITFTQPMTLDASGNLLIGTTTNTNSSRVFARGTASSSALALQGATGDVALAQLTVGKFDNNTTTSQVFVRFTINDNSGGSGQINANGASQAAFGSFSDSRLKDNIVSLPSQLANILSLRPVEFDYKDGSGHQIGFVAQEMQEVYSDAVGEQNGFLTVTGWSKTEARLVSAIKELAAKVQALETKLA